MIALDNTQWLRGLRKLIIGKYVGFSLKWNPIQQVQLNISDKSDTVSTVSFIALVSNFAIILRGFEGIKRAVIPFKRILAVLYYVFVICSDVFGKGSCLYVIPFVLHRRDSFHNADHADT